MKKIILLLLLALNIKAGVVIDSLSKDTVCQHSFLRVYCHTTGTVVPSQALVLYFNGAAVISGTYQQLADSNCVWGFVIPLGVYPGSDNWAGIALANGTVSGFGGLWFMGCDAWTGISEINANDKIISVKYTSLMGEVYEVPPVNQVVIKETKYTHVVKREKIFILE